MQDKIETKKLAPYIVSQCLGSLAGTALVAIVIPELSSSVGHGVTNVAEIITPGIAILLEAFLMMIFVLMIFWMTASHERSRYTGLMVFLIWSSCATEGPLTGTSINPARIGPAIVANNYADLAVYIIDRLSAQLREPHRTILTESSSKVQASLSTVESLFSQSKSDAYSSTICQGALMFIRQ